MRRVIGADGRSRAYVNGQVVPLQALRELAEFLIEIHGQQEFQHLVNRGAQREMLDEHLERARSCSAPSPQLYERYRSLPPRIRGAQSGGARTATRGWICCAISSPN